LLRAHFADMPRALSPCKALAVAEGLQLDLPQETFVNQFTVSLRQIQRIKYNIVLPWFYSEA